ncbi:MAG: endonuclease IV [Ruminococcaceae bacterium]|nr:endonuclease IV [Oscillospiraceae bacterium]
MTARFGPAGNSESFAAAGFKSTLQAPAWLAQMGLTAYEYQCGRGVRVSVDSALQLGALAKEHDIALSLHAPYFISLASVDPQKRDNSITYILDSARAVSLMGGDRIVVHPGGLGGRSREEATALAKETLVRAQAALDENGLSGVHICPETMGKINQLGNLDEVLDMCTVDERFYPCIDFGHLNSRTQGEVNSTAAFEQVIDTIKNRLGEERGRCFHVHFSKIAYTAGGEKCHLTFDDDVFGPDPAPLMEVIAARNLAPVVICESAGTQAEDALAMMQLWKQASR